VAVPPSPPLVSVVIPTRNRARLVERAVDSVFGQTYGNIELIVIVDGPDPVTIERLRRFAAPNLSIVEHATSLGAAASRNTGIALAKGSWIAFLDDDDYWEPTKLERQVGAALADGDPHIIVTCLSQIVTALGRYVWPRSPYDGGLPLDEYLFDRREPFKGGAFLQTSTLMVPRALFEDTGFAGFTHPHEDWDLGIRAVKQFGYRLITVAAPLSVHFTEDEHDSVSRTFAWRESVAWLDGLGKIVSPRAYAGFCLTIISPQAAQHGDLGDFFALLRIAFAKGRPRLYHVMFHCALWIVPVRLRRRIRSRLSSRGRIEPRDQGR
jgi:glycosyltransferase involved in cell wall biosynthesis